MPNKPQLVFLLSFLVVFSSLLLLSHFIKTKLNEAGYHISHLILIGLPPVTHNQPMSGRVEVENIPGQAAHFLKNTVTAGELNLLNVASSPAFLVAAAAIVLATVFYAKVFNSARPKPLDPSIWKEFPLQKKTQVSPNTAIYSFKLPHAEDVLGLPIGQHISVSADINGKNIVRNYTPISQENARGRFELIIKTYEKGNISRHVASLKIGDKLRVKGPKGNFKYTPGLTGHLGMIAGGTGLAPMIQIVRAILQAPADRTNITLIYANVNEEDILLRAELDALAMGYESRFTLYYVLNNPPSGWTGGVGFVTKEHIKNLIPNPNESNSKILICGPPPMVSAMKKNLEEIKYPVPNTISKLDDKVFVF